MKLQKITREKALDTIKEYINKSCLFESTGDVWYHEPGDLAIKFYKPEKLTNHLSASYSDEMMFTMECLNEYYEWNNKDLVPIAAVSSCIEVDPAEEKEFTSRGMDYYLHNSFGYLFFELSSGKVITTQSDDWSQDNKPYTIEGLIKEMGVRITE